MKIKTLVITMLCAAVILGAGTSRADEGTTVPPGCQEGARSQRAYEAGRLQGKSLVQRAWLMVNDCDQLERFSDIVVANVESYVLSDNSAYVICRYTGMTDGVYEELDNVWLQCGGECCSEGEVIGELAAEIYCQLSILLDGLASPDLFLRRPVHTCGFAFEVCCDIDYVVVSQEYPMCLPYTLDPYYDVWDATRVMQCSYTPPEVIPPGLELE